MSAATTEPPPNAVPASNNTADLSLAASPQGASTDRHGGGTDGSQASRRVTIGGSNHTNPLSGMNGVKMDGGGGDFHTSNSNDAESASSNSHSQHPNVSSPGNSSSSNGVGVAHHQQHSGMPPNMRHHLKREPPPPPPPPLGHSPHHHPLDMMRRGSLNSAAGFLDDSLFRRPSLQLGDDLFHRRDSMDSSTAALDAAIMDLSRRRYSMAAASTTSSSAGGSGEHEAITARQQQLQQQQRELEQQQKELEIQRQQLIASMQGRSYHHHPHHQQHHHSHLHHSPHRNSLGGGSLGLGSVHSQTSLPSLPPMLQHRHSGASSTSATGSGGQWWICQVCNSKAFNSHEEAMQHEATCGTGHSSSNSAVSVSNNSSSGMMNPIPMHHNDILRNSGHPFASSSLDTSYRGMGLGSPMENSSRGVVSMGMDSSRGGSMGFDCSRHNSLGGGGGGMDTSAQSYAERTTVSMGPFAMLPDPIPLSMPSDKDWLTPLHCFVRRHCVEVFTATDNDVATPSKGKRKPIQVGQIGIRCPHCHILDADGNNKARERGSVYYPTTIASIYNATMNLLQRHLHNCPAVPDEIMRRYETLKADDARSGTSKRYWIESALSLGLVDTPAAGIRHSALRPPPLPSLTRQQESTNQQTRRGSNEFFSSKSNADHSPSPTINQTHPVASEHSSDNQAPLVSPEDKPYATTFSHHLLCQMQPCVFTEADRLGKRKGLPPGFPGLACRHCFGGYGSGRFFPSSIKTLSDTSKTLNVLHNHMMRCRKCPADVKENLEALRGSHDEERAKMKFGSQKAFFARIWQRLHGKDAPGSLKRGRNSSNSSSSTRSPPQQQQQQQQSMGYPGMHHMPPPHMSSPGMNHHHHSPGMHRHHQNQSSSSSGLEALASVSTPSKRHKLDV